jgi:spermidine dehydrogenase
MRDGITRRDFLYGVALSIGSSLISPPFARAAERYPPALTGPRGSTDASYSVAHALRDGRAFRFDEVPSEGDVDLVVVGAGISGLAAAHFFQQRHANARILILDNHDDFGGHARRCELPCDETQLISYGGSESIQSPASLWSETALGLLADLKVDLALFEQAFNRTLYPDLGLSRGLLFTREWFGVDKLVTGDPTPMIADDIPPDRLNARSIRPFIQDFPLDNESRTKLIELYTRSRDFWPGHSIAEKIEMLSSMTYHRFLREQWGLSELAARTFRMRPQDFFAIGSDLLPAFEAASTGYPGFQGLGLPTHPADAAKLDDPYIHHFPDGNASIARLLVRKLIPAAAPGHTMEDIVLAPFDYGKLDEPNSLVRLRLESTVALLRNVSGNRVEVGYVQHGSLKRVHAKRAVYAGYNMMLPYVLPDVSRAQREALAHGVKAPLVYAKIAVRNWQAWVNAGVHEVTNTSGFYARLKLDYPVSLGGYRFARTPREPTVIHLVHVPLPDKAPDQRSAWRAGRTALYERPFADFERHAFDELGRILGPSFDPKRDVTAISVYRWGHGYAYGFNSVFDPEADLNLQDIARRPIGRIAVANSDAAWSAYAHAAIDEAARAVVEVDT